MNHTTIRVKLPEELFRRYKVFCAMDNKNMTQMTAHIVREYVKQQNECVKIINVKKE